MTLRIPLLRVHDLTVEIRLESAPPARALESVSFEVYPCETLALVGESGCGKSTTLMALMRLLPVSGRIATGQAWFEGETGLHDLFALNDAQMRRVRWREIAIAFQSAMNALNPVETVGDQIREAIQLHEAVDRATADKRVAALFDLVGIARNRINDYPHQFSGGMRQRAMIAMALACKPKVLFADEPTTALDVMVQAQVLDLLKRIQRELGLGVVLVTHDLGVVAETCDRVIVLYGGRIAEAGTTDSVFNRANHPYTQRLLEAFPDVALSSERLVSIPGAPPRLNALTPGCRFAPRCHKAFEPCRSEVPAFWSVPGSDPEHVAACHLLDPRWEGR